MFLELEIEHFQYDGEDYSAQLAVTVDLIDEGIGNYDYGSVKGRHVDYQMNIEFLDGKLKRYDDYHDWQPVDWPINDDKFHDVLRDHIYPVVEKIKNDIS